MKEEIEKRIEYLKLEKEEPYAREARIVELDEKIEFLEKLYSALYDY